MKKVFIIVICLFALNTQTNAQFFAEDSVFLRKFITEIGNQDFDVDVNMTNSGPGKNFTWYREIISLSSSWTTAVCDPVSCKDVSVETGEFSTDLGNTEKFFNHFYMSDQSGGNGSVRLILMNDSSKVRDTVILSIAVHNALLGNESLEEKNAKIYPNPANGNFNVEDNEIQEIVILNAEGKEVLTIKNNENSNIININTDSLETGIYFVKVKKPNTTTTQKVIVGGN